MPSVAFDESLDFALIQSIGDSGSMNCKKIIILVDHVLWI